MKVRVSKSLVVGDALFNSRVMLSQFWLTYSQDTRGVLQHREGQKPETSNMGYVGIYPYLTVAPFKEAE